MNAREELLNAWPVVGDNEWTAIEDFADVMRKAFPEQDADELVKAIDNHGPPAGYNASPVGLVFTHVKCTRHDVPTEDEYQDYWLWTWYVTFADGTMWMADGGCDYTGWDCQSHLTWTLLRSRPATYDECHGPGGSSWWQTADEDDADIDGGGE